MSNYVYPKLIFVDGPTAVGKDYFISKLTQELDEKVPHLLYDVVRATDIVLEAHTESENRKYTVYKTEEYKRNSIYLGHIRLLCYLHKRLNSREKDVDILIVNRSFLSFLIYNVYPMTHKCSKENEAFILYELMVKSYIQTFLRVHENLFHSTPNLFINLTVEGKTTEDRVTTVSNRIKGREDSKPVSTKWLFDIINEYDSPDPVLMDTFGFYENTTSSGYNYISTKYF